VRSQPRRSWCDGGGGIDLRIEDLFKTFQNRNFDALFGGIASLSISIFSFSSELAVSSGRPVIALGVSSTIPIRCVDVAPNPRGGGVLDILLRSPMAPGETGLDTAVDT